MAKLEDLKRGVAVKGLVPDGPATIVDVTWHGDAVVEVTYRDDRGETGSELLYRDAEDRLELVVRERPWQFDGDAEMLRLVSEARRISLAHLFDPLLAVHSSVIDPLPHQITAVYGEMLPRQPLKFLLADDPGAGKTIMAGLLIKELKARGDVQRCLICAPGSLVEQWQDEMQLKFGLPFEIITRERIESSRTGNPFSEYDMVIGRLDQLARADDIQAKLEDTSWDLVICDEAHKMAAHAFGQKIEKTRRYELGELLSEHTRHLLLMTATPHSGKDEDFQLFMQLLDPDRFEGRPRDDGDGADASDLMRRMVKEDLLKFDRTPLFPERKAYAVSYQLSEPERDLYERVTEYVTEEMNRADRLRDKGQGRRSNNVGFALTVLQRRLASSPEAIYRSLQRRRERLEKELEDLRQRGHHADETLDLDVPSMPDFDAEDDYDEFYDRPDDEVAEREEEVLDRATAAMTMQELELEIASLTDLEEQARRVRNLTTDKKWDELSSILQQNDDMFDDNGQRRKLIIFTEHRDTLRYLEHRIRSLLGRAEAVVTIHGGVRREDRRATQDAFVNDPSVIVLIATDAAGEGVNLQRAHLMVNYDLPWNPNRIEQRFGRIHRIGQTEVCHLWNLVAGETREGAVYERLLQKLENVSEAMKGKVFDVLGKMFEEDPLRDLLVEAIRYGEDPKRKAQLYEKVEAGFDPDNVRRLFQEHAIAADTMDTRQLQQIREEMERAEARKLQPHFVRSFFEAAFRKLGGRVSPRETGRFEITRVPAAIRSRSRTPGRVSPVLERYERVCFEKQHVTIPGRPQASLLCPGHPLLDAVIEMTIRQNRELLKRGAVLVDPSDATDAPRVLFYLEHEITDSREVAPGQRRVVSRRMEFVEIDAQGNARDAGYAPYLDYRPAEPEEQHAVSEMLRHDWLDTDLEGAAKGYAIAHVVPRHMSEVRQRVETQVDKTLEAVRKRLTREIAYWDRRANELKAKELAGKRPQLNSGKARQNADELQARLKSREAELARERALSTRAPIVVGGALVVPQKLLCKPEAQAGPVRDQAAKALIEKLAMDKVAEAERSLGREPRDVSDGNSYDIESRGPETGELLMIEVKGRTADADTVCVTRNEILTGANRPENYILAIVRIEDGVAREPLYVRQPFQSQPDFAVTSVNYKIADLMTRATPPA